MPQIEWKVQQAAFTVRPYPLCQAGVVRMQMVGANPAPQVQGEGEQPGKIHYLTGARRQWRTNVPTYGKVRYTEVYPGIDLVYHSTPQGQLEYDFVVAPGADPKTIRLTFAGLLPSPLVGEGQGEGALRIDPQGDLLLQTTGGALRLRKPVIYQEIDGNKQPIAGHYILNPQSAIGGGRL